MNSTVVINLVLNLLSFSAVYCQTFEIISEFDVNEPTSVSLDELGNLYFSDYTGNIYKYSKLGIPIANYSSNKISRINHIDAKQSLRVFAFSSELQRYFIFDRFLNLSSEEELKDDNSFIKLSTQGKDNNLWLYDETNFSLVKYNPSLSIVITETPLELLLNSKDRSMNHMVEYRNQLYISGPDYGIIMFDNLGNYIGQLLAEGVEDFDFNKDEIYYLQNQVMVLTNLYSDEERKLRLSETEILFAKYSGDFIYIFSKSKLKILRLKSD